MSQRFAVPGALALALLACGVRPNGLDRAPNALDSSRTPVASRAPASVPALVQDPSPATMSESRERAPARQRGIAIVADSFTGYRNTADLRLNFGRGKLYTEVVRPDLTELDTAVRFEGHATLKLRQPGGSDASTKHFVYFPNDRALSRMWLRATVRFSPGWSTVGTKANTANSYKLLAWGWPSRTTGRGTVEITNTRQYQLNFGGGGPGVEVPFAWAPAEGVTSEWRDGGWYDFIVSYEVLSATTARARLWRARAGGRPRLTATVLGTAKQGSPMPVRFVVIGLNYNQQRLPNQEQAVWIGRWEVFDGEHDPNPFGVPGP